MSIYQLWVAWTVTLDYGLSLVLPWG